MKNKTEAPSKTSGSEEQNDIQSYQTRNLSLTENVVLTIKVLTGAGLVAGLFWLLDELVA